MRRIWLSLTCARALVRSITASILLAGLLLGQAALAQSLIRDAEIEEILRGYATPIFAAAGLNPKSVNIYLVNDNQINAFVAGGQNVFFTTELLLTFDNPSAIKGVIAHEVGHIAGGHLSRSHEALKGTTATAIASMVLGIGTAALGAPDVGFGIITGGQHIAQRNFLAYSRTQESAADQAAVSYLETIGETAEGLLEVLHNFGGQEALNATNQDPFVRSHPLSSERIGALEERVANSPVKNRKDSPELTQTHLRMQGKLYGFLKPAAQTFRKFPLKDQSIKARYARAVANYRRGDIEQGLKEIDALIAEDKNNAYYNELKGQILFENGRIQESIPPFLNSVALKPQSTLLRVSLAQAMLATEDAVYLKTSLEALKAVMREDPENSIGWHQLALAYARDGQDGMAALSSAERFFRAGGRRDAFIHSQRAMKLLPEGSAGNLRAQDIFDMVKPKHRGDIIE